MCYKYPGPRCSAHAKKILNKAYKAYVTNSNPEDYEKYAAWRDALTQFEMTPAGQKEIQKRIEETTDLGLKNNLIQHLQDVKRLRAEAIAAIGAEDKGDIKHSSDTTPLQKRLIDPYQYERLPFPTDPYQDNPPISETCTNDPGIDYDYISYGCSEEPECDEPYCHHIAYVGLELNDITAEEYLTNVLGLPRGTRPPAEWTKRLEEINFKEYIEVEVGYDYYGERPYIVVNEALNKEVENMYYGQPNATDSKGLLVYSRQEGIDTTGLTPVEAIKKTIDTSTIDETLHDTFENSTNVTKQRIRLSEVTVTPHTTNSYNFSQVSTDVPAGILMRHEGTYVLIGGEERFKGAVDTNKKFWNFLVLE